MIKRLLSVVLAVVLCCSLAAPALAADASGLDANGAKAFYNTLSAYGKNQVIAFADLKDMDGDSVPELIVITVPKDDSFYQCATVDIWQIKNGNAVKTVSADYEASRDNGMKYISRGGTNYIYVWSLYQHQGVNSRTHAFISANGSVEELDSDNPYDIYTGDATESSFCRALNGKNSTITETEYIQFLSAYVGAENIDLSGGEFEGVNVVGYYEDCFLTGSAFSWYRENTNDSSYQTVLNQLNTRVNAASAPASGTYGAYTISGDYYTITFDRALVEKTAVEIREEWEDYSEFGDGLAYSTYNKINVTRVKVLQGSNISITNHNVDADFTSYDGPHAYVDFVTVDGGNRYTVQITGAAQAIKSGTVGAVFQWDLIAKAVYVNGYLIEITSETADPAPAVDTTFTDVPSTAYYASAVTWAVGKGITNGTGTNKFSPENTCNNAEILTFIWRAKGQPEPTIFNPFSNVNSSDFYYKAALWAYQNGLVTGSLFNASVPCTRSMAVTYLWKAAGSPAAGTSGFTDVPASVSYAQAVAWAVNQGITNGDGANKFSPDKTCTRGQIVTFLYRAFA